MDEVPKGSDYLITLQFSQLEAALDVLEIPHLVSPAKTCLF